jgi:hypothetical protein
METYCKDEDSKESSLNLITHVEVEAAHQSDANALIPAIESAKKRDLLPEELAADALYGSDENSEEAKQLGVELIAPTMGSTKEDKMSLADFEISQQGQIISCPEGHAPAKTKKNKRKSVGFDSQHCRNCSRLKDCPVKKGKKFYYLRFSKKEMRIAQRRVFEQTDEFKDRYRWRAGIEATMSEYNRRTGVKQLRVRGMKAVKFSATLKALAVNILRAAAVRKAAAYAEVGCKKGHMGLNHAFFIVKEQFRSIWDHVKNYCGQYPHHYDHMSIMVG